MNPRITAAAIFESEGHGVVTDVENGMDLWNATLRVREVAKSDPAHVFNRRLADAKLAAKAHDPIARAFMTDGEVRALNNLPPDDRAEAEQAAWMLRGMQRQVRGKALDGKLAHLATVHAPVMGLLTSQERTLLGKLAGEPERAKADVLGADFPTWAAAERRIGHEAANLAFEAARQMRGLIQERQDLQAASVSDVDPVMAAETTRVQAAMASAAKAIEADALRAKIEARKAMVAEAERDAERLSEIERQAQQEKANTIDRGIIDAVKARAGGGA